MFSLTLLVCFVLFGITGAEAFGFSCTGPGFCIEGIGFLIAMGFVVILLGYTLRRCYQSKCGRSPPNTFSRKHNTARGEDYPTLEFRTAQEYTNDLMMNTIDPPTQATVNIDPIPPVKEGNINKPISDITEAKDITEQAQDAKVIIQVPYMTKKESKQEEKPKKEPIKFFSL